MTNPYDDMIHLPHHVSTSRPRMPIADRAAQFSPFAALTGHSAAIAETARLTDEWKELSEDAQSALAEKLNLLSDHIAERPEIAITYFQPDEKKSGGSYVAATGVVKKIDDYAHMVVLTDGSKISMRQILNMESALFA